MACAVSPYSESNLLGVSEFGQNLVILVQQFVFGHQNLWVAHQSGKVHEVKRLLGVLLSFGKLALAAHIGLALAPALLTSPAVAESVGTLPRDIVESHLALIHEKLVLRLYFVNVCLTLTEPWFELES